jgi:hypothetical protein
MCVCMKFYILDEQKDIFNSDNMFYTDINMQ